MAHSPIIEVKNLGKRYDIMHQQGGYIALRDVLAHTVKNPLSFLKKKVKDVAGLTKKEDFWALRNLNFTVEPGEVVGVIGHNGAGKSTLLKILTGITPPTEGEVRLYGKVSSLLEVGTGFHPELTGRENIFLNGAILGMPRREIAKKFDEIVAFAGVERFIDTPVKHFSSGMYVRLAFSVAAHMEPDILLVDEVLAVGDAEFQKKCLGKMEEITSSSGRTILFVSHNIDAILKLCPRTILLSGGKIEKIGPTQEVVNHYIHTATLPSSVEPHKTSKEIKIHSISSQHTDTPWVFNYDSDIHLNVVLENFIDLPNFQCGIGVNTMGGEHIMTVHSAPQSLTKGVHTITVSLKNILTPGTYQFTLDVLGLFFLPNFALFHVIENSQSEKKHDLINTGFVDTSAEFRIS